MLILFKERNYNAKKVGSADKEFNKNTKKYLIHDSMFTMH